MAKTAQELLNQNNVNKGITTGLDSEATVKPQPSKDFNSGSNKTDGANPESPSTNNATRREKYGISQGTTVPESTKIGAYDTVSPVVSTDRGTTPDSDSWNQYTGYIKKIKGNSFITTEYDKLRKEIEDSLRAKGIDTTKEVYGSMITDYVNKAIQAEYDMGAISAQMSGLTDTQAYNVKLVDTLAKETWAALAQGKSIPEIAQALGQEEWVIQKIAQGKHAELIQLSQEYEDEQMRKYLRYKEDLDTQIARNITQYQNAKTNLDYQFNSAVDTLKRSLFDAEWTARGTAAGLGMTGTSYLLDRIQTQYTQQMNDLQNTYDYQSANAQIAINNALEDYTTNVKRYMEDYSTAIKEIQSYVYDNYLRLSNQMLSAADQLKALNQIKANVEEMKAKAIISAAAALEDGNISLYNYIKNAYGLSDLNTITTTGGGTYTPASQTTVDGALYTITSSSKYADKNKIRSGECGTIVNDYLGMIGAGFKISYASDMEKYINYRGTDPMVGSIVYFAPGSLPGMSEGGQKYGHVAIVTGVDKENGKITVRESNAGTGIRTHEYNMSDVDGYFNPVGTLDSADGTVTGYNENYTEDYDTYLNKGTDGFKKASQEALIQKFGSWDNFVANAKAYQKVKTKQDAATMLDSLKSMQDLRNAWGELSPAQKAELGTIGLASWGEDWLTAISNLGGGDISDVYAKFNTISAQGFIDTLVQSKKNGAAYGQLSDAEGTKINKAWSELTLRNPGKFDTVLGGMISNIYANLKELGYTDEEINSYIGSSNTPINITSNLSFPNSIATGAGNNVGFVDFSSYSQPTQNLQ